jgi:membrane-associated phospholipid phosphatase
LDIDYLWQALLVSILLFGIFFGINYCFIRKTNFVNSVAKWSVFASIALILSCLVVFIMKAQIHRERYFQLETTGNESNFKPWYSLLWNMNTTADGEFTTSQMTSFPSGHTTWAMNTIVLIPLIYIFFKTNKSLLITLCVSCIGFVIVIMFCRIATGNHYLSDVSGAVIINLSCYMVVFAIIYFRDWNTLKKNINS